MSKLFYILSNSFGVFSIFYLHYDKIHASYTSMVCVDLVTVLMVLGLSVWIQVGGFVKRGEMRK